MVFSGGPDAQLLAGYGIPEVRFVPEAWVIVPLLQVGVAIVVGLVRRPGRTNWMYVAITAVACLWAIAVVKEVLLPLPTSRAGRDIAAWHFFINLRPLQQTEGQDMAENVLLFVPLGVVVPFLTRARSWWRPVIWGFAFSLTIEVTQLITDVALGATHAADINDLAANVVGALVGWVAFRLASFLPVVERLYVRAISRQREDGLPIGAGVGQNAAGHADRSNTSAN